MKKTLIFLLLGLFLFTLDISTKSIVEKKVPVLHEIRVTSFLNIVHLRNTGAVFGIFSGVRDKRVRFVMNLLSITALLLLLALARTMSGLTFYVTGAMVGGALGNIYERLTKGYVVDFIDLHIGDLHWPAFNVADTTITVGMMFLIVHSLRSKS